MEILTFILSAIALLFIYLIGKSVLRKDTKDLKMGFGFFKGFEFSCSFYNKESNTEHQ